MASWRDTAAYGFDPPLDKAEWAWQFLRRHHEYRADYAWFIATWRALEADYGAPPQRDFFRWRQDPRAWRREAEPTQCGSEGCAAEDDKLLIECWMGAKWGLRKFPLDPALARPLPGRELDWREQGVETPVVAATSLEHLQQQQGKIALGFDLSLPLPAQLLAAQRLLIARRRGLERAGGLPPRALAAGLEIWTTYLRVLDGVDAGASLDDVARVLGLADAAAALDAARAMAATGYRRILLLEQ